MKGSGMPQMRAAFGGWTRRMTLIKRMQRIVDGLVNYIDEPFTFRGTIQPLSPKEIALKPDGQRAWTWLQIHCMTNDASILNVDDQIFIQGKAYKVMATKDYSLNGFIEYHVVQDYQK